MNTIAGARKRRINRKTVWGYIFVLVPLVGFLLFNMIPLGYSLFVSLHSGKTMSDLVYVGIGNFQEIFTDADFYKSLLITLYSLLAVVFTFGISLMLAVLLTRPVKFGKVFRTLFMLPNVCSVIAMSMLWKLIYQPDFGLLTNVLSDLGFQNLPQWLSDTKWAMPAMLVNSIWLGFGFNIILFMAGLLNVPASYYEAAKLDGANGRQIFFSITMPTISPTSFYVLVISLINCFQDYVRFRSMTEGGPNGSTTTLVYYCYSTFVDYMELGKASALAWILGAIILAITLANFKLSKRWVHYEN